MKLATLKDGTRDGRLVVVDDALERCTPAIGIAATLQAALDQWSAAEPALLTLADRLNGGEIDSAEPFSGAICESPLPRAYQFADGSAFLNHMELVRKARGAEMPESLYTDPLMYQGLSDGFLGPCDNIALSDENWGIDFEAEIAVVTDDVPMGVTRDQASAHIKTRDAVQRRQPAHPGARRNRQGIRLLSEQTRQRFFTGRRDTSRARQRLGRRPSAPAAAEFRERRGSRASERRDRHDLRLRRIDRARRPHPPAGRRHDHRVGHGVEQGSIRWIVLPRGNPNDRDAGAWRAADRRSSNTTTAFASRCRTRRTRRSSAPSIRASTPLNPKKSGGDSAAPTATLCPPHSLYADVSASWRKNQVPLRVTAAAANSVSGRVRRELRLSRALLAFRLTGGFPSFPILAGPEQTGRTARHRQQQGPTSRHRGEQFDEAAVAGEDRLPSSVPDGRFQALSRFRPVRHKPFELGPALSPSPHRRPLPSKPSSAP